jgi:hypothetical protein
MVEESTQVIKDTAPPPPPTEVVNISASPTAAQISVFMAEMGRRGGKIGGKRRAENMTPKERSQLALKAAKARWNKRPG